MDNRDLTLVEHLTALRRRVLFAVIPALVLLAPAFLVSPFLLDWIYAPATAYGYTIYLYGLTDGIVLRIRLALLLTLSVCAPWALAQAFIFMIPGLLKNELKFLYLVITFSGMLFLIGVCFFIVCLTPFLVRLWNRYDAYAVLLSATTYYNVWEAWTLTCGLLFMLPLLPVWIRNLRKLLA